MFRTFVIIALSVQVAVSTFGQGSNYGQFAPEDAYRDGSPLAYYGSENEWSLRQFREESADRFYKRQGQRQILAIIDGRPVDAIRDADKRLQNNPQDVESLFNRAVAHVQLDEMELACESAQEAIEKGLPVERFLAGPRHLLQPLIDSQPFQEFIATKNPSDLLHGPMLGSLTDHSVQVWVRTSQEEPVTAVVYSCDEAGRPTKQVASTARETPSRQMDFTARIPLKKLEPNTEYAYDLQIAGKSVLQNKLKHFHTFPATGEPGQFRIAFGGGAGFTPSHERIWNTIASFEPQALFLLGDNVYIDLPQEPRGFHRYTYYRRQSRSEFRQLVGNTAVFAIWDDHDCATDDVWMGPYVDQPTWKPAMLQVFQENWVNPSYGNQEAPGCWFQHSIGDVDFFFLDGRYYRTNPYGENPTMLGPIQKEWLRNALQESEATFKVLVSPVPWAPNSKPGSRDTWDGFAAEREEIFSWIGDQKINGVLLLAADRHRSEARTIERPEGYPLYELMSSRLTNIHTHECLPESLFCYNEKCSFGTIDFDTTAQDPSITYQIVNIDGDVIHTLDLKLSELSFE